MKRPLLFLFIAFSFLAPSLSVRAEDDGRSAAPLPVLSAEREYVILSGGPSLHQWEKWKEQPHDLWWQNFIRAGEIRIRQLIAQGVQPQQITWFVYMQGYKSRAKQENMNLITSITALKENLPVNLRFFDKTAEVIAWLNGGKPREQVKIADLEYFGHSNKACFMFDYSNNVDSASKVWLHENELGQIRRDIFTSDAFVKSWGCHTGESMSQKFRRATGIRMWGAVGRSQYNTHELPTLASPDGKWRY